ncbi:MAG: T9SS type A sorting domain-containing protein, partial [Bacteroidota bacterium]
VRVYAFDDNGSTPDYCEVVVEVQDNMGWCEDESTGDIAGVILTEEMEPVEHVIVELTGPEDLQATMTTTADGTLRFNNLELGGDYTVAPSHFTDYLNGVRTSDIVAATRHILGVDLLETPYLRIAADANGDQSIDVGDILTIRSLILGLTDEFPNGVGSWAFVPVDYEFPQPDNPWVEAFPEVSNFNDMQGNIIDADFVGIKIGDLNRSAVANSLTGRAPRSFRGDLELELDEVEMIEGETYTVPVTSANLTEVDGYQFTLEFDQTAVEIEGIEPGLVTAANFGWRFASQGLITTSWSWTGADVPAEWTGEEVLFSLVVRAEANGLLSKAIDAGNRFTEAEAYERNSTELRNLTFIFNEEILEVAGYRLLQNIPNPVRQETVIGFELPEAHAEVVIAITDAAGRLVREVTQEGTIGYNSITLTKRELGGASGVYSYTVTAGDWVATKRMVIME